MKVLNIGSLNFDYVYSVEHMVQEGETLSATKLETFFGGKGINQAMQSFNWIKRLRTVFFYMEVRISVLPKIILTRFLRVSRKVIFFSYKMK